MLDHKKGPLSMAPENGNFFIYTKHGTRWMCSVIDGVTGYLDGHITVSTGNIDQDLRVRENNLDKNQYIEHSSRLNWNGRYTKSASEAHVGAHALRWAFDKLYVHVTAVSSTPEGKRVCDDVPRAGEIFVLHFAEAARFDSLFLDVIDKKFETNESIGVGPQAIRKAHRWSSDCKYATELLDCGSSTEEDKRKAHDKLKDIRLIHRPSPNHGYFLLKDMPIQLTADGAVLPADENAGRDDPNMIASCPYLKAKNQLIQATTIEEEAQYDISLSLPLHTDYVCVVIGEERKVCI
uniref:rRNA N-glycosidase n=1 Tax=Oryza punctata TaxID=4537 RepID=A0A0E0JKN6_ORYPU